MKIRMAMKDAFIAEMKHEAALTKKILEKVPLDKKDWKPHAKSMTVGRLATHIAEIPHWITEMMTNDVYDFAAHPYSPRTAASQEELISIFQTNLDSGIASLEKATDEDFAKTWVVKRGEHIAFQTPRKIAIRGWAFSHLFHHRGQLSVYLRLLDVPIPGMYGPSADER